jgi:hypothetical protein
MRYLFWLSELSAHIHQHCEYTKGWHSWTDWREMFNDGLTVTEAFAECHREG